MNSKNEIVTLQFGHYSNYIGAHWWNLQEANFVFAHNEPSEVNYDVLYREGENYKGVQTFTPRLLLMDLKGSLHNLPMCNTLYDDLNSNSSEILWDPVKIKTDEEPKCEKNEFLNDLEIIDSQMECDGENEKVAVPIKEYNLTDSVSSWTDYCSTVFHPRTINIVNSYRHNDEQQRFNVFTQGTEVSKDDFFKDDWADKCRLYVEECNTLQGFQVLFDCYDAYGGLTRAALEHLKDEYSSKPIIAFPAMSTNFSNTGSDDNAVRTINTLLSVDSLITFSSIFVPLAVNYEGWTFPGTPKEFRYLKYDDNLCYHTAAILASYLDTITLRYRRRELSSHLIDLCHKLSPVGRICLAGTLSLPFDINTDASLLNVMENKDNDSLWTSLTPYIEPLHVDSSYVQDIVLRGFTEYQLYSSKDLKKKDPANPTYNSTNAEQLFSLYLHFLSTSTLSSDRCVLDSFDMPMKTNLSFPSIFSENGQTTWRMKKCPIVAGLHNSSLCENMLSKLISDAKKINLKHYPQFFVGGLEQLDYGEALENVLSLGENYL